jgi:hypothetical protein
MPTPTDDWRPIRALRAEPPAFAGVDSARRAALQEALAQAEELWDAAAVVNPTTRALPLLYSLSQAGPAICAAWLGDDQWVPRAHGLRREEAAHR